MPISSRDGAHVPKAPHNFVAEALSSAGKGAHLPAAVAESRRAPGKERCLCPRDEPNNFMRYIE